MRMLHLRKDKVWGWCVDFVWCCLDFALFRIFFAYGDGRILTSLCYDNHNWASHRAEVRILLYLCLILVIAGVALVLVDALVEVRMLSRFDFILLHFWYFVPMVFLDFGCFVSVVVWDCIAIVSLVSWHGRHWAHWSRSGSHFVLDSYCFIFVIWLLCCCLISDGRAKVRISYWLGIISLHFWFYCCGAYDRRSDYRCQYQQLNFLRKT